MGVLSYEISIAVYTRHHYSYKKDETIQREQNDLESEDWYKKNKTDSST